MNTAATESQAERQPDVEPIEPVVRNAESDADAESHSGGGEMRALAWELENGHPAVIERVIRNADAEHADRIGRRHGYRVDIEPTGRAGWALMVLSADADPNTDPVADLDSERGGGG